VTREEKMDERSGGERERKRERGGGREREKEKDTSITRG